MNNLLIAFFAYLIDKYFGEFAFFNTSKLKHPVVYIGTLITFFEQHFYKNSITRGLILVLFVLTVTTSLSYLLELFLDGLPFVLELIFSSFFASIFIAYKMLHDSVEAVLGAKNKQEAIAMLVSRDTQDMNESDIYKASVETYAENLSDGVIAPLFYLSLFGMVGIVVYKTINTLDSMVGYKNERYEKFGKVAARLDDIANFIPARLTAFLIIMLSDNEERCIYKHDAKKHESPNAGYPISAMAYTLHVRLGGPTSYFGKIKEKAYFGVGRYMVRRADVIVALNMKEEIDKVILFVIIALYLSVQIFT